MYDGSSVKTLQIVLNSDTSGYSHIEDGKIHTGAAITVKGSLVKSPGAKQNVESVKCIFCECAF